MKCRRDKIMMDKRTGLLLCIIKNQIVMMEALKKSLETYPHTSRYGSDYMDLLQSRIDACEKMVEV